LINDKFDEDDKRSDKRLVTIDGNVQMIYQITEEQAKMNELRFRSISNEIISVSKVNDDHFNNVYKWCLERNDYGDIYHEVWSMVLVRQRN
jgi:hypothetical protein